MYARTISFTRMTNLIINVAVSEHGVEVLHALAGTAVVVIFQSLLYSAHVHGSFDDLMIVLEGGRDIIRARGIGCSLQTVSIHKSQQR